MGALHCVQQQWRGLFWRINFSATHSIETYVSCRRIRGMCVCVAKSKNRFFLACWLMASMNQPYQQLPPLNMEAPPLKNTSDNQVKSLGPHVTLSYRKVATIACRFKIP